ncbi:MAG: hypothetical protein QW794_00400 [Thermosphaera sp.]
MGNGRRGERRVKRGALPIGFHALLLLSVLTLAQPSSYAVPANLLLNSILEVYLENFKGSLEITFFLSTPAYFYTDGLTPRWHRVFLNSILYLEYYEDSYTVPPSSLFLEPGLYRVRVEYTRQYVRRTLRLYFSFNSTITIDPYGFLLETDFPLRVVDVKLNWGYIRNMRIVVKNPTSVEVISPPSDNAMKCPNLYRYGRDYIFLLARPVPQVQLYPFPSPCTVYLSSLLVTETPFGAFNPTLWNVTYPDGYSELVAELPSFVLPGTVVRNATPIAGVKYPYDYIPYEYIKGNVAYAALCDKIVDGAFSYRLEKGKCNLTLLEVVVAGRLNLDGFKALDEEYVHVLRAWKTITVVTPRVLLARPLPVKVSFDTTNLSNVSLLVHVAEKTVVLPGVLQIHRDLSASSPLFPVFTQVAGDELLVNVSIPFRSFPYPTKSLLLHVVGSEESSFQPLSAFLYKVTVDRPSVVVGEGRPLIRVEREGGGSLSFVASSRDASKWGFYAPGGSYVLVVAAKLTVMSRSGGIPVSAEVKVVENGRVVASGKGALVEFFLEPGKTYTVYVSYAGTTLSRVVSLSDDAIIEVAFPSAALLVSLSPLLALLALLLVIITVLAVRHSVLGRRRFVKLKS